ncbi:MAG: nucleoid occlusion protein [Erysipelothrix sp.]|nr:nucleoid occlusion protein [Erysipelothrix sp.]
MKNVNKISIDLIKPNRYQPRSVFDDDKIMELAQSIRENGLIQPIVVRVDGDKYEIIAGERRYRASILAGLVEVDVIIKEVEDKHLSQMALVENIQREDLTSIEEARAYLQLQKQFGMTQDRIAKQMGKSQSTIANKLRLLNLEGVVQNAIANREISERHARALLSVEKNKQVEMLNDIIEKKLTVNQTEDLIKSRNGGDKKAKPTTKGFSRNHQLAINTINQAVKMAQKFGIDTNVSQEETDEEIRLIITIQK